MRVPQAGFTLVEVLVATALLWFLLLGVAPLFVFAAQHNAAGADFGTAGAIAVARMETLRALAFTNLTAGGSLTSNVSVGGVAYFDASNPEFIVRWEILDSATPAGGKRVTVRALALRAVSGMPKECSLTTLRAG